MINKIYMYLSKYLYLDCASRLDTKSDYSIIYDSKFCADECSISIQKIFYNIMPKLYIALDENYHIYGYIPIKYNKFKNKLYLSKRYSKNTKMKNIINALNKRISLINIYFADKSCEILDDSSFQVLIKNLFNDEISDIELLKICLDGGNNYES